jgi:hypothetical protein
MVMPSPLRDIPRPRRQQLPRIVTAIVGVATLIAVLAITLGAESPSTSAIPVALPTLRNPLANHIHRTKQHVDPKRDKRELHRQFPVPRQSHEVRATPRSRAFTVSGTLHGVASFYERRLHHLKIRWHATNRMAHGHVAARMGRLTSRHETVGYLAIRQTDVGLGIVVRFRS